MDDNIDPKIQADSPAALNGDEVQPGMPVAHETVSNILAEKEGVTSNTRTSEGMILTDEASTDSQITGHSVGLKIIIFVLVLGLGLLAGWLIHTKYLSTADKADNKPTTTVPEVPSTPQSTSSTPATPRISSEAASTNIPSPAPIFAKPTVYSAPELGVTLTLPANWRSDTKQHTAYKTIFYNNARASGYGAIEAYQNLGGETLESLRTTLAGSETVTAVTSVTIHGQDALEFYSTTIPGKNIALIRNNKIYYFTGAAAQNQILSTVKFL